MKNISLPWYHQIPFASRYTGEKLPTVETMATNEIWVTIINSNARCWWAESQRHIEGDRVKMLYGRRANKNVCLRSNMMLWNGTAPFDKPSLHPIFVLCKKGSVDEYVSRYEAQLFVCVNKKMGIKRLNTHWWLTSQSWSSWCALPSRTDRKKIPWLRERVFASSSTTESVHRDTSLLYWQKDKKNRVFKLQRSLYCYKAMNLVCCDLLVFMFNDVPFTNL